MDMIVKALTFPGAPYDSLAFSGLATLYIVGMSGIYHKQPSVKQPRIYSRRKAFGRYVNAGAWVGLWLPLAYLGAGHLVAPRHSSWGWRTAGPHIFLLAAQVASEVYSFQANLALPVWILIPPLYNARRMFTIYQWLIDGQAYGSTVFDPASGTGGLEFWWLQFGQLLAVANFLFWGYNLFGFLLPVCVPDALRVHFALHPNWPRTDHITLSDEARDAVKRLSEIDADKTK